MRREGSGGVPDAASALPEAAACRDLQPLFTFNPGASLPTVLAASKVAFRAWPLPRVTGDAAIGLLHGPGVGHLENPGLGRTRSGPDTGGQGVGPGTQMDEVEERNR